MVADERLLNRLFDLAVEIEEVIGSQSGRVRIRGEPDRTKEVDKMLPSFESLLSRANRDTKLALATALAQRRIERKDSVTVSVSEESHIELMNNPWLKKRYDRRNFPLWFGWYKELRRWDEIYDPDNFVKLIVHMNTTDVRRSAFEIGISSDSVFADHFERALKDGEIEVVGDRYWVGMNQSCLALYHSTKLRYPARVLLEVFPEMRTRKEYDILHLRYAVILGRFKYAYVNYRPSG